MLLRRMPSDVSNPASSATTSTRSARRHAAPAATSTPSRRRWPRRAWPATDRVLVVRSGARTARRPRRDRPRGRHDGHDRPSPAGRFAARLPRAPRKGAPRSPPDRRAVRVLPARRSSAPGAGRSSSMPRARARAGASAISPTCAGSGAGREVAGRGDRADQSAGRAAAAAAAAASPYFPSSRLFRNPLFLRVEELPGARELRPFAESGRARARR